MPNSNREETADPNASSDSGRRPSSDSAGSSSGESGVGGNEADDQQTELETPKRRGSTDEVGKTGSSEGIH